MARKTPHKTSKLKAVGAKKKTTGGSKVVAPRSLLGSIGNEVTLPTERDIRFLVQTPLTPPVVERLIHSVVDAFPGHVVATLKRPEVGEFFGKRVKSDQIAQDAELALEATAVYQRLAHGAARAQQIAEAPLQRLQEQAARIVRDVEELTAEHPELADGLKSLTDWWSATFPGGGSKAKSEPAPAAPAASVGSGAAKVATAG